jgi:hypothetical protein
MTKVLPPSASQPAPWPSRREIQYIPTRAIGEAPPPPLRASEDALVVPAMKLGEDRVRLDSTASQTSANLHTKGVRGRTFDILRVDYEIPNTRRYPLKLTLRFPPELKNVDASFSSAQSSKQHAAHEHEAEFSVYVAAQTTASGCVSFKGPVGTLSYTTERE